MPPRKRPRANADTNADVAAELAKVRARIERSAEVAEAIAKRRNDRAAGVAPPPPLLCNFSTEALDAFVGTLVAELQTWASWGKVAGLLCSPERLVRDMVDALARNPRNPAG
jgi:hypothetical protein